MKLLPCTVLALAAALLPAAAKDKDEEDKAAPDASVSQVRWGEVVNDVAFDPKDVEGKVVVVEEWGVNCGPCIASLPDMAKLAKRYAKKGLVVVGLEVQGGTEDEILDLLKEARVKYPVTKGGNAPVSTGGIPHACIFGTDGKLIWHGHPADDDFERQLKKALRAVEKE